MYLFSNWYGCLCLLARGVFLHCFVLPSRSRVRNQTPNGGWLELGFFRMDFLGCILRMDLRMDFYV
jgi:hypothetical protein